MSRFRFQQINIVFFILLFMLYVLFLLQFSLKTTGIYKATISDDRGKDMSQIDISGKGKYVSSTLYII